MFIQCQNCQATYRIDEQKIPDQNTFVRCAKCNSPISLNKQEQSVLSKKKPHKIVDCPSCSTRYSIPMEKIADGGTSVRCGKCGHMFQVSADEIGADIDQSTEPPDIEPFSQDKPGIEADDQLDLDNIDIPEENEIEVDGLFDEDVDLEENDPEITMPEELADFEDPELEETDNAEFTKGPTEEYLESIDLTDQIDEDLDSDIDKDLDEISSEDKDDLFLKPTAKSSFKDAAAKQLKNDQWPDIHDETDTSGMGIDEELNDFVELDDLNEIQDSADYDADNPLELQEMTEKKGKKRVLVVFLVLILLAVLGAAGWFYYKTLPSQQGATSPVESFNNQSRLKLMEPLRGKLISNTATGEKIFVLEGEIKNNYTEQTIINWIEVKGVLYDKNQNILSESRGLAGKVLTIEDIQEASSEKLNIIRSGKSVEPDLELAPTQTVPFQILFFNTGDNIQKLQAQISRFSKKQTQ